MYMTEKQEEESTMTEILIYAAILTICVFAVIAVMAWLNDALEEINRQERREERIRRHRAAAERAPA